MKHLFRIAILFALLSASSTASAAVGTIYVDTGGCETASTSKCSGTTDSASASAKGAAATITCSGSAGPASGIGCSITGSAGQLSGIAVDGSQAIFINCATNTNQKIFWINSVDDTLGLVGTTLSPTGCTAATSDWGIGGRYIYPSGATVDSVAKALRAGDTMQFNNTPASKSVAYITAPLAGDSTTGCINVVGKTGVRPILQLTANQAIITLNVNNWFISNLEFTTSGTSVPISNLGGGCGIDNIKITATGVSSSAHGITTNASGSSITNSEITGVGGDGINSGTNNLVSTTIAGNYIHDLTGSCIALTGTNPGVDIIGNVLDTCAGRGVLISGSSTVQTARTNVQRNTIYGNTLAGFEVTDPDSVVTLRNNIIMNTNSADIVKWTAGNAQLVSSHGYNVFYSSSSGVLNGLTANATEFTTNPLFVDAPNANFALSSRSSPAANAGFMGSLPIAGGSVGYLDIGAIQGNASAAGSGGRGIIGG